MKKFLSLTKTAIVLLVVTVISLGVYAYLLARPISYGMEYRNELVFQGQTFEGKIKFYSDGTMVNVNSNFDEEIRSRYYYQDGYVFFTMALTDEAYEKEVAMIQENFDELVSDPFYAAKINAFQFSSGEMDELDSTYTCKSATVLAVVYGVFELLLIGLTCTSVVLNRKAKNNK